MHYVQNFLAAKWNSNITFYGKDYGYEQDSEKGWYFDFITMLW